MTFAPLIDQRPLIPDGSEDCFEACLGMVLGHLGHPVDMAAILADHAGSTDIPTALAMCQRFGLQGVTTTAGGFDNNDKLVIALIHDNSAADPAIGGAFEHYIVVYGQSATGISAANPWGARDIWYWLAEFNPAYIEGIEIPISINQVTGDDMNAQQAGAIADMFVRTMQHLGVNIGDSVAEASATADLNAAILAGNGAAAIAISDGATYPPSAGQLQAEISQLQAQIAHLQTAQPGGGITQAQIQQIAHDEVVKALKAGEAGA